MDLKAHVGFRRGGYYSDMTIVSRKKKSTELCWVLRPARSRHRRLVFKREARAYLWRTTRHLELVNN